VESDLATAQLCYLWGREAFAGEDVVLVMAARQSEPLEQVVADSTACYGTRTVIVFDEREENARAWFSGKMIDGRFRMTRWRRC
jgi:hypothetical protein